ncbi:MAG: flagellar motor switch protein FliM [Mycobacteriales bacterium]|jgi:flagellar motor switch protein FliM
MGSGMTTSQPPAGGARAGRATRRGKADGPLLYDFRRPTKLSREYVRRLQIVYETFARRYGTLLTSTLRVVSHVTLVSIEQLTYDEYITSLASPTMLALVTLEPLPGTAVLEFSLTAAMASLDHMLGGPGGDQPQRPLTDIEEPLLRRLIDRILDELRLAYEPIVDVVPLLGGIEYNPQFAQAGAPSDAVVVASFELRVGDHETVATFCLPLAAIYSKLNEDSDITYSAAQREARALAHRRVVASLEDTPIEVSVRFSPRTMRPVDLAGLRPGDVVPLEHPVTAPLDVMVAGVTFAYAVPGNQGSRLACLVVPPPKEPDDR